MHSRYKEEECLHKRSSINAPLSRRSLSNQNIDGIFRAVVSSVFELDKSFMFQRYLLVIALLHVSVLVAL